MSTRLLAPLLSLAALAAPLHAQSDAAGYIARFQEIVESGEDPGELFDSLEDADSAVQKDLIARIDKAWPKARSAWIAALESAGKQGAAGSRNEAKARVRELRAEFMRIYGLAEGAMKEELKTKSLPAVEELRKLLAPTAEELAEAAPESSRKLRTQAHLLAAFRDAALEANISTTPADTAESLAAEEERIARQASQLPKDGLRILEKNRRIAGKDEVPADEAKGIEECNLLRLYVGLDALTLDPKLCDASRDHSKDMAEKGFFAHESPVPGKKTPWDRARNFGTSASGENIYAGSTDPHAANMGWFHSPGHHKNMFGAGHKRIGLGRHDGHWTQMFGN